MPDPLVRAHDTWVLQLEKADSRVNYRMVDAGAAQRCGNCRYYNGMDMSCNIVEGSISASCGCDLWTERMSDGYIYGEGKDHPFSVFVESASTFADSQRWIPFLPKPGKFQHPRYGEIEITAKTNQEMVDSVTNHVYQEHIPLDAEHETKLSGAVAWIQGMRMNDDGSADAYIEWTDRGRKLIDGGGFKYVSPEWFDEWREPATGVVHRNVVAGGAITTRPFFKDQVLRALVAGESGTTIIKSDKEDDAMPEAKPKGVSEPETPNPEPPKPPTEPVPPVKTFTEDEVKAQVAAAVEAAKTEAAGVTEKTFSERITAAETAAEADRKAREALETRLAERDKEDRGKRFAEVISGRGGTNDGGPAWAGDAATHLSILEKLADQFGEKDETLVKYIEQQNATAIQLREASIFKEFGSGATAEGSGADHQIESMAKKRMAEDPKLTYAAAFAEVMETPEAKKLYEKEHGATRRGA